MITINTDKGLVKVENWDDIIGRPGFNSNLDPKNSILNIIIGKYQFPTKVKCGLSSCHTPHTKGYLVSTKDGSETNIGKDCGAKYFGVDFEVSSRQFDREIIEADNRDALWAFFYQIEEIEKSISEIRNGTFGADNLYKKIQPFLTLNKGFPAPVYRKLRELVKTRSSSISSSRIATDKEVEDMEAISGKSIKKPHYIEDKLVHIEGIEALYQENDLRDILVKNLSVNILEFKKLCIDKLSYKELQYWAKWKSTINTEIDKAKDSMGYGIKLIKIENLEKLLAIPMDHKEKNTFRYMLKNSFS